jgi:hypothetical protein
MMYLARGMTLSSDDERVIDFGVAMRLRAARAWPRALVMLLLGCLLIHGTAIQTHIHFTGQARFAAAMSGTQAEQTAQSGGSSDATQCPLCQDAAMAGAYLLPPAIIAPSPPAPFLWIRVAAVTEFGLLAPVRGWLSRAPPR